jgi:hypothetical protein
MNKTIEINPDLFKVGGFHKTKKNNKHDIPKKHILAPTILKNKFLKRIKHHKQNEIKQQISNKANDKTPLINTSTNSLYDDEFNESLNYFNNLSKNTTSENSKKKQKENLERKSLKKYYAVNNSIDYNDIQVDLPVELIETPSYNNVSVINETAFKLNPPIIQNGDVAYGILKNGTKPTYRTWCKTQKNISNNSIQPTTTLNNPVHSNINPTNPNIQLINPTVELSEREKRFNILKNKLKDNKLHSSPTITTPTITTTNTSPTTTNDAVWMTNNLIQNKSAPISTPISVSTPIISTPNYSKNTQANNISTPTIPNKKIIKKTIRTKYKLGKSTIKRSVGILMKNRTTRKKVLLAHRNLKRQNINDVKKYLREHNLIKIGSNAPNDVVRKIYENAMLSGEIYNNNKDTLLHNIVKSDDN